VSYTIRVDRLHGKCRLASMNALDRAIEKAGGPSGLARSLQVKPNVVTNWRLRGQVPAEQVLAVEAATGISRHDLRPDVFGPPPADQAA
jgi:DNA-binding transcriptional regulator YdaS (Cro superfamily)